MKHYLITLIHGDIRIVRNIIAASSRAATRIALGALEDFDEPCAIISKRVYA